VILAGDAPPGSAIPLDDVATALGMSVIPVRESLKILIGEGLVEQHMRGAYTVARLSRSELLELYTARGVLENTVLAVAVAAADHADHTHARAAHDLLDRAVRAGDLRAYHRESRGFHFALLTPGPDARFVGMVESAWNLTESYRPMALLSDDDRERLHADHGEMLAAFVARDSRVPVDLRGDAPPAAARRRSPAIPPGDAFADEPTGTRNTTPLVRPS
jgi:DNA-binding GntR family transcriptional regulator